jgi:hypothetical protein
VTDATYDRELDFESRCDELVKRVDAGQTPTQLEISRALALPLSYVAAAIAISTIEFVKSNSRRLRN